MRKTLTLSLTIAVVLINLIGCGSMTFVVDLAGQDRQLKTTVVESDGRMGSDRIAIIDITGMIYSGAKPGILREGESPVSLLHEKLEMARRDSRVKAVILRLNTPGGTVTASDVMFRHVRRFQKQTKKPVVALMMDVAASGGYYVACACDQIVAYPTTITGSIGVIVQTLSLQPALGKLGITAQAITSGPNKDIGSPLSQLTDKQRAVLQQIVDDFYARFIAVVRQARPNIPADQFKFATDGRVVTGDQALKWQLIDRVGDLYDAVDAASALAGIGSADLVMYRRPLAYVGSAFAQSPQMATTQINLAQINLGNLPQMGPGFAGTGVGVFYLWHMSSP